MLAGYCTISEYDRWVNQNAEPTNQNEAGMTIGEGNQ
jgi:hypothetical protein